MKNFVFLSIFLSSVAFAEKIPCSFTTDENAFQSKKIKADFETLKGKLVDLGCTFVDQYKVISDEKYQIYTSVERDYDHPVSKGDWKTPTNDSVVMGIYKKSDKSFPLRLKLPVGSSRIFGGSYEKQIHKALEANTQNIIDAIIASEQQE